MRPASGVLRGMTTGSYTGVVPPPDPALRPQRTLWIVLAAATVAIGLRAWVDRTPRELPFDPGAWTLEARPVDLNEADVLTLTALPGVGPEKARRIVEHRGRIGGFTAVDQLLDVEGIGPRTLERLRPKVTLSAPR